MSNSACNMAVARTPPPTEVQNHPRFCSGAGSANRFRLLPGVSDDHFLAALKRAFTGSKKLLGLTSFRMIRFEDGTYLNRMTYGSAAAWKRSVSDGEQASVFAELSSSVMDVASVDVWIGMFELIPARFAPDLDNPTVPRPINPSAVELSLAATAKLGQALPEGSVADLDDRATASSAVSMPAAAGGRQHVNRRLPSIGSARTAAHRLSPSASSIGVQPPSAAYTEARSSAGLSSGRESLCGDAERRHNANFGSYWRSSAWASPPPPQPRPSSGPRDSPVMPGRPWFS